MWSALFLDYKIELVSISRTPEHLITLRVAAVCKYTKLE